MNKSMKAALLSALVFPGAGHIFLKRYISAAFLASTALSALYIVTANILERALQITDKILQGELQPDIATITEFILKSPAGTDTQFINIAVITLTLSWLIGILDSFRAGYSK